MNRPRKKILRKFVPGLQQLKQLAEQYLATGEDEQNVLEGVGICGALFALTDVDELVGISIDAYDLVECLAQNWPEYSGNSGYPVPHQTLSAEEAFDLDKEEGGLDPRWAGKYGAARLRLLDYLIAECSK